MASKTKNVRAKTSMTLTRENWLKVRFGDVVREVKATVDRDTTDLTRFIAGEHMGSEDLHLRTWGDINGDYLGPAFHRMFRKGQVLYGSRRTYLKKVAVASFDGICANTTFVLESKDTDVLLPELLPFIMLTDAFTQHSVRESKGSVNPYINWRDIAKYEFLLPPKDEQRRIADVLLASDDVVEFYRTATSDLRHLFDAAKAEYLGQSKAYTMSAEFVQTTIGNSAEIEMGASPPGDSYNSDRKGFALLNGPTEFGERYPTAQQWTTKPSKFCKPGDILFCVRGSTTGRQNIADAVYCLGRGLAAVRGLEGISRTGYLRYILQLMEKRILEIARGAGSTFPNMNKKSIEEWPVFLPSLSDQDRIVSILDAVENQITSLSEHTKLSEYTKQQLVNSLIEGRHQIRG